MLCHGAYHQAWHLHLLKSRLESDGYAVSTSQLASALVQNASASTGSLSADVTILTDAIENAAASSTTVIPVFHSYSGFPGSEALAHVSPTTRAKIPCATSVAAFLIPKGHSCMTGAAPWKYGSILPDGESVICTDPETAFYYDVKEKALVKAAVQHVVPHSLQSFLAETEHEGWAMVPGIYVRCTEDETLEKSRIWYFLEYLLVKAGVRGQWELVEMEGGHSPFLSRVEECVRLIEKVVKKHTQ